MPVARTINRRIFQHRSLVILVLVGLWTGSPTSSAETSSMKSPTKSELNTLLETLEARFKKHMQRHPDLAWKTVEARLAAHPGKMRPLFLMEETGGEPDVVAHDLKSGEITFFDCSPESPKGRVALCYDRAALESRKEHKPKDNAMDFAAAMGVEMLDEAQYHQLQTLGEFDLKTSSWVKTPDDLRKLGGALFGDRRFGRVFIYHNGAQSYYSARGFRACLKV